MIRATQDIAQNSNQKLSSIIEQQSRDLHLRGQAIALDARNITDQIGILRNFSEEQSRKIREDNERQYQAIRTIALKMQDTHSIAAEREEQERITLRLSKFLDQVEPSNSLLPNKTIELALNYRRNGCTSNCKCSCHLSRSHQFRLPNILRGLLGSLFIGYTGYPVWSRCNSRTCLARRSLRITYVFPKWALEYALHGVIQTWAVGGPSFAVVARRRVQYQNSILEIVNWGGLTALKRHLEMQPMTVNDLKWENGTSALHIAFYSEEFDIRIFRLLLESGADPDFEDDSGYSVRHLVAERILFKWYHPTILSELSELLPPSHVIEDLDYNFIHKIVLRICPIDLSKTLRHADDVILNQVNGQDKIGNTPLHLAATQGDTEAVRCLLASGARVDIRNAMNRTALIKAMRSADEECVDAIINAGTDLNVVDSDGDGALHHAAMNNLHNIVGKILDSGVDVNIIGLEGKTALNEAARYDYVETLSELCSRGADVEVQDMFGTTPLLRSIEFNSHACLRMLLNVGANHCHTDTDGSNILHIAARNADSETFEILSAAKLKGLNTATADFNGWIAYELFEHFNPERRELAFIDLLQSIDEANSTNLDSEVFYDAREWAARKCPGCEVLYTVPYDMESALAALRHVSEEPE